MKKIIISVILSALVLISVVWLLARKSEKFYSPSENLIGQLAPSFSLNDLNEKKVNSADFIGKSPTLLFFWTTWCPHCRSAIKELNEIAPALEKKGGKIITIDLGEESKLVSSYMKEHNYNLTVLLDEASALVDAYGIVGVPTFFLLGRDGKVKSKVYAIPADIETILFKD